MARQRSQPTYRERRDTSDIHDDRGTLYIVGTPIGSFDDLSLRGIKTLKEVSIIAAETPLVTRSLLAHHRISTTVTSYGPYNRDEKIAVLLHYLQQGQHVALVSDSGMPVIYDPGRLLIASAQQAGYPVTVIPGPSAVTAAVALSGQSGDRIVFEGRVPQTSRLVYEFLEPFRQNHATLVMFVPSKNCLLILRGILRILPSRTVTVAVNMTKTSQRLYQGSAASLLGLVRSLPENSEVTVVVAGEPPNRGKAKETRSRNIPRYSPARRRITTR